MTSSPLPLRPDGVFLIAEAGVNHNGHLDLAMALIDAAAGAGADAVKFQMFDPDELVSAAAPLATYQERSGEANQKTMLERLMLPREAFRALQTHAESRDIGFMVTPFDALSADVLADMGVHMMKMPSGELTNIPFLRHVASHGIPTILSTGMATLEEVQDALVPFQEHDVPFALLHCVSAYPAPQEQLNLRAMETLRRAFGVPVGFSDHSKGIDVPVMAAALGAEIIEKHFTLDRTMTGPDHAASLEPDELQEMIRQIRDTASLRSIRVPPEILGDGMKRCQPCEEDVRRVSRRSVTLLHDATAGTILTNDMLAIKRPGTGIAPKDYERILGRTLTRSCPAGTPLTWEDVG